MKMYFPSDIAQIKYLIIALNIFSVTSLQNADQPRCLSALKMINNLCSSLYRELCNKAICRCTEELLGAYGLKPCFRRISQNLNIFDSDDVINFSVAALMETVVKHYSRNRYDDAESQSSGRQSATENVEDAPMQRYVRSSAPESPSQFNPEMKAITINYENLNAYQKGTRKPDWIPAGRTEITASEEPFLRYQKQSGTDAEGTTYHEICQALGSFSKRESDGEPQKHSNIVAMFEGAALMFLVMLLLLICVPKILKLITRWRGRKVYTVTEEARSTSLDEGPLDVYDKYRPKRKHTSIPSEFLVDPTTITTGQA